MVALTAEERKAVDKFLDSSILTIGGKRIDSADTYEQVLCALQQRSKRMMASAEAWGRYMEADSRVGGVTGYRLEAAAKLLMGELDTDWETWDNQTFQRYLELLGDLCRFMLDRAEIVQGGAGQG